MTNREIDRHIIAVAHGDKEALRALYLALRKPVFVLALTIGHDRSMAEDVVQDTFVAVCERSHTFRTRGKGQAWVLAIARNLIRDAMRAHDRCCLLPEPEDWDAIPAPDDFTKIIEQDAYVAQILRVLNEKERRIVILHTLAGLKLRETADLLSLPKGSVYWAYNSAVKKLKCALSKEDPADEKDTAILWTNGQEL